MKLARKMFEKRMNAFLGECEQRGVRITHQRMEIFRAVASTEEHPDAVTIHRRVRKRTPTISLDTVYRNLKLLAAHGMISIVGMSQENLRFDANVRSHHHFVCMKCGMIRDFSSDLVGGLAMPDEARAFGNPVSLHLEVKGVCTACQTGAVHG